jgi:hypothetical protein
VEKSGMTLRQAVRGIVGAMGYAVVGKGYADEVFGTAQENARLRDERDALKAMLETAAIELRRPKRRDPAPAAADAADRAEAPRSSIESRRSDSPPSSAAAKSPLRVVCVGTGRDGTTSLAQMIQEGFDARGCGELVNHEWASVSFNAAFCDLKETGDPVHEQRVRAILRDCPNACIVGNGYAAILPIIAEMFGSGVTLVHLRRRDRTACVASLARNAELYPVNHRYYADPSKAIGKRMAAFHFGEMSEAEWNRRSLTEKFGWYYDKTHALVHQYSHLFAATIEIETESLGDDSVRAALAQAVGAPESLRSVHLNRHVEVDTPSMQQRIFVQRLLGKLDVDRLAKDDLYGLQHFVGEYVHYLSALMPESGDAAAIEHLNWLLTEAHAVMRNCMVDMIDLQDRLNAAQGSLGAASSGREMRVA